MDKLRSKSHPVDWPSSEVRSRIFRFKLGPGSGLSRLLSNVGLSPDSDLGTARSIQNTWLTCGGAASATESLRGHRRGRPSAAILAAAVAAVRLSPSRRRCRPQNLCRLVVCRAGQTCRSPCPRFRPWCLQVLQLSLPMFGKSRKRF
jgi:hypothetical protein